MNTTTLLNLGRSRLAMGATSVAVPFVSCALLLATMTAHSQVNVYVDATKPWIGYMNVFELPANGGGYDFGSVWGTADLDARFAANALILTPNTSIDRDVPNDPYWWVGGAGGAPNKSMDALMYVQNDTLAGQTVTFSGNCQSNTLVAPYTSTAFIKDLVPDFSSSTLANMALVSGQAFSITFATAAGHHVQYGFETIGPDARLTNVANLGEVLITAPASTNVYVDPSKTWIGYMNVFELPANGGAYDFGSVWGTADLDAVFSAGVATLTPNTSIDRDVPNDPYWWVGGAGGAPNKNMDANFYVENSSLAGLIVTFSGYCWTNTLVAPYTSQAFIKELDPNAGYATVNEVTSNLASTYFSITTSTTVGHIVQYGFETVGPDARITNEASLGQVLVASNPPPSGPAITSLLPANPVVFVGANETFTVVATGGSLHYQWRQNGVNLTNNANVSGATGAMLTLSNVQGSAEANYTVVVYNSSGTNSGSTYLTVLNPAHLTVDPNAPWVGFENWFFNNGGVEGAFLGQSAEAPAHLPAGFSGAVLTLAPNTSDYNPSNPEFVNPDGSAAAIIEADFYVQDDALAGQTLTFVGYCPNNTLAASGTSASFIEDFAPSYASYVSATNLLVSGQPFSITLATTVGDHIEYGFQTVGPVANPATVAALGQALVSINPPSMTASITGSLVSLSFPTESGLNYTVLYKNNLTDSTWQTLSTVSGTASTVTVTDSTGPTHHFYQLSIR